MVFCGPDTMKRRSTRIKEKEKYQVTYDSIEELETDNESISTSTNGTNKAAISKGTFSDCGKIARKIRKSAALISDASHDSKEVSKFRLDASKYQKLLLESQNIKNNDLMQTALALKSKFPFKAYLKNRASKGDNTVSDFDVCGLDNITLQDSTNKETDLSKLPSTIHANIDCSDLYFETNSKSSISLKRSEKVVEDVMKKSVLPDDLEKMEKVPKLFESEYTKKLVRKKKQEETAGKGWYNLPKTEITEDIKRDLQLIKMRNVLNRKQHYKRNDTNKMPKYFQIGTIVEGAHEFYSARVTKKKRKVTMVDELLDDAEFRRRNKKKCLEIQKKQMSGGKAFYKKRKNQRKSTWART